jgi:hypothetical protein
MSKIWKPALFILLACVLKGYSYDISEYPHKSKYDSAFAAMNDTNILITSLNDKDLDVEFSALKRIGELRIMIARKRVEDIIAEANPEVNQGKAVQRADFKYLFDMGVLVLGKIGDNDDAITLSKLLRETSDSISLVCLLQALGDLSTSDVALQYLHQYAGVIDNYSDARVVKALVDSIEAHHSRTSVGILLTLINQAPQNLRDYINDAVKEIEKAPVTGTNNSTNK